MRKILPLLLVLLLAWPAGAYDHKIHQEGESPLTGAQVRHIVEVTEILCGARLDSMLTVVWVPEIWDTDGRRIHGYTFCQWPYRIIVSEWSYPVYGYGLLAHEIAHNLRPELSELEITRIEYQFRSIYNRT